MSNDVNQHIQLEAGQNTEVQLKSGQTVSVQGADAIQVITTDANGAMSVTFTNGAKLTITNFSEVSSMGQSPQLALSNGQNIPLSALQAQVSSDMTESNSVAPEAVVISKPSAQENVVVTMEDGTEYSFGFALQDANRLKTKAASLSYLSTMWRNCDPELRNW